MIIRLDSYLPWLFGLGPDARLLQSLLTLRLNILGHFSIITSSTAFILFNHRPLSDWSLGQDSDHPRSTTNRGWLFVSSETKRSGSLDDPAGEKS